MGHVVRMEEGRSAFNVLADKPTGKRSLGRPILRIPHRHIIITVILLYSVLEKLRRHRMIYV